MSLLGCNKARAIQIAAVAVVCAAATHLFAATNPPVFETFSAASLPSASYWSFGSNGNGRVMAMGDPDGAATNEAVPASGSFASNTASARFIGNVFLCTNNAFITSHELYLARTSSVALVFAVYTASTSNGLFNRVASNSITATAGTNFVSSGSNNIPLTAGRYYLIGASWQEGSKFYWLTNAAPVGTTFGVAIGSAVSNIYPAPLLVTNGSAATSLYRQRITTTREGVIRMDDSVSDALRSTNSATLTVDLENYTSAWLTFRHREAPSGGDQGDSRDGIFLSTNGLDYVKIVSIDQTNSAWTSYSVNLAAAAASNGITFSDTTHIRFGQEGTNSWPAEGREFDDIVVSSAPDLYNANIDTTNIPPIFTFKGTSTAKALTLVSGIYKRGGTNAVIAQDVTLLYRIRQGSATVYPQATNWSATIPALNTSLQTLTNEISVPPSVLLSNHVYTIESIVDATNGLSEGNELNNTASRAIYVNHYSGKLYFDNVATEVTITNWSVRGPDPDAFHTISGYGDLNGHAFSFVDLDVVKDLSTLDYKIDPGATNTYDIPGTAGTGTVNNIDYLRMTKVTLSTAGAEAIVRLILPAGLGQSTSGVSEVISPYLPPVSCKLAQGLYPLLPVNYLGPFFFCEETKPLRLEASDVTWEAETGRLILPALTSISYVRTDEITELLTIKPGLANPDAADKKSNEQYYQYLGFMLPGMQPVVRADSKGAAELTMVLDMTPGNMVAHFPYDTRIHWSTPCRISITNDLIDPLLSEFGMPANAAVSYARDCPATNCSAGIGSATLQFDAPAPGLRFSIDGGMFSAGSIISPTNLTWGSITNGNFAQKTDPFAEATFVMAGHFLRGDQSTYGTAANEGPGELLLSGVLTNTPWSMERPGTAAYEDGEGDYAGLNFRVMTDGAKRAISTIGGTPTPSWSLAGNSKYYARASGISGIHQADSGSFPSNLVIYGYTNTFTYYGLSYLSSEPYESLVEGSIDVPYPSDFTQEFDELMFTCLGELTEAKVPTGGSVKHLSYWQSDFTPYTIRFAELTGATCGNNDRFLAIGVKTFCANVDQPLYGELGFEPTGNLIPEDAGVSGVDSRLRIENDIELDGPNDEVYVFTPVAEAYYNNYDGETNKSSGVGFISFAGTVDVPFFEDLKVQFHTSANTNTTSAAIYMMGGWPTDGKGWTNSSGSFFDTAGFDTHNSAYPTGAVTLAEYRDGSTDTYKVRACKTWLDVIDFDYPLNWSWVTRSFTSFEPTTYDFMILTVEHQIDYMSAENVELSFGLQYDGLPQINLANMAFNAIDEATGMSEAFVNAVGSNIWKTVGNGISGLDDVLSDLPDPLFDPLLNATLDPFIDGLYNTMSNAVAAGTNDLTGIVKGYLTGIGSSAPATNATEVLADIVGTLDRANSLITNVSNTLARITYLIDAFTSVVSKDPDNIEVSIPAEDGLLTTDTDGNYSVLRTLAAELLGELAGEIASAIGSELESRIQTAIADNSTSLEAIAETLIELRGTVTNAQTQLNAGQEFILELKAAIDTNIIQTATATAATNVNEWLASVTASGGAFTEYTPDEIKALIRQKIQDEFYGTEVVTDIQQIMRERLYDLDSAIRESVDTVFSELNQALRNIASEYLSSVDDSINGMLGDLGDTIGSGQIDGYAHIAEDSLKELRLDGKFQWEAPDAMEFQGYLQFKQLDSDGTAGCGSGSGSANEVSLGAIDMGLGWMGSDIKATIGTKFTFETTPDFKVIGMAGSFEMTEGKIGFESFSITELAAAVAFGAYENYLSANVRAAFDDYVVEGGIFFGRTCTLDPILLWDPLVASVLGDPPFTGIYVYGEGWMPIYNYGCLFTVSAGVGAGFFYFVDGPVGGKLMLGAEGEALCAVNIRGEVVMAGAKDGDDLRLTGQGTISGKAGVCPLCVKFNKTVGFGYDNGTWSVDY